MLRRRARWWSTFPACCRRSPRRLVGAKVRRVRFGSRRNQSRQPAQRAASHRRFRVSTQVWLRVRQLGLDCARQFVANERRRCPQERKGTGKRVELCLSGHVERQPGGVRWVSVSQVRFSRPKPKGCEANMAFHVHDRRQHRFLAKQALANRRNGGGIARVRDFGRGDPIDQIQVHGHTAFCSTRAMSRPRPWMSLSR